MPSQRDTESEGHRVRDIQSMIQSQRDTESEGAESEGLGIRTQRYTKSGGYRVRGSRVRVNGAQSQRDTRSERGSEAESEIYRVRGV